WPTSRKTTPARGGSRELLDQPAKRLDDSLRLNAKRYTAAPPPHQPQTRGSGDRGRKDFRFGEAVLAIPPQGTGVILGKVEGVLGTGGCHVGLGEDQGQGR